jgi:hypothetical protein
VKFGEGKKKKPERVDQKWQTNTIMASKAVVSFVLERKDILLGKTGQFLARSCIQVMSEFAKSGSSQVGRQVAGKLEIL